MSNVWVGSDDTGPIYVIMPGPLLLEPEGEPWVDLFSEDRGFTYEAYMWNDEIADWEYIPGSACNWFDIEPEVDESFCCTMLDDVGLKYPRRWTKVG